MDDVALAAKLADKAGRILLSIRRSGEFEGNALGKAGDAEANAYLISELKKQRPDDAILSEEEQDSGERLKNERVWIIDPLDGTREYGDGRDDWAVHVALAVNGKASIGAVALPAMEEMLLSSPPAVLSPANSPLVMAVSRTRPAKEAVYVAERLGAKLLPMGSAGAKAMAVVRGEADIYLHSGGQYEWDNCAPVAVAQAAGLHCSRIDGSQMRYNNPDTYLPDLLICRQEHAKQILAIVAAR
ncbi:MAG: 3'(2'),5'-bisphosphate nucleotidase CysQ [Sphingorhabdus sp.]